MVKRLRKTLFWFLLLATGPIVFLICLSSSLYTNVSEPRLTNINLGSLSQKMSQHSELMRDTGAQGVIDLLRTKQNHQKMLPAKCKEHHESECRELHLADHKRITSVPKPFESIKDMNITLLVRNESKQNNSYSSKENESKNNNSYSSKENESKNNNSYSSKENESKNNNSYSSKENESKHNNSYSSKENESKSNNSYSNDLINRDSNDTNGKDHELVKLVVSVIRAPKKSSVKKSKKKKKKSNTNTKSKEYNATWYKDLDNGHVKSQLLQDQNASLPRGEFTNKLWKFYDSKEERLFLYGKLLEYPWLPNHSNLQLIRDELYAAGFDSDEELVVTKQNAPLNSQLKYYLNPRHLPNGSYRLYEDYFVNADFWNRLPEVSPLHSRGKPYGRCAVVGNSGILLDSKCGEEIDTYDMIVRCNAAPIAKFAQDAGWRTNLTSFNPSIFSRRYDGLKSGKSMTQFLNDVTEFKGHLWFPCFGAPHLNGLCMKPFMRNETRTERDKELEFVFGHPHHFESLWTFWKKKNITNTPSTGFYFTHTALQLCEETHLYGFWPFPVRIDSRSHLVPYHYFDYVLVSSGHGMSDEFSMYIQYHQMGVLRVHHGECKYRSES